MKIVLVLAAMAVSAAPHSAPATHADFAAANEAYLKCLNLEANSIYDDKLPLSRLAELLAARCATSYETFHALAAGERGRQNLSNYTMALFAMTWQQCKELNRHEPRPIPCKIGFSGVERYPR